MLVIIHDGTSQLVALGKHVGSGILHCQGCHHKLVGDIDIGECGTMAEHIVHIYHLVGTEGREVEDGEVVTVLEHSRHVGHLLCIEP